MQNELILPYAATEAIRPQYTDRAAHTIDREPVSVEYQNPVVGFDFPDPGVQRTRDGFIIFGTQSVVDGQWQNIQALHTRNFASFTRLPDALPMKPASADGQDVWAPHGFSSDDEDFLAFNSLTRYGGHGIYLARRGEHGFIPRSEPLVHGEAYKCIDAFPFQDPKDGKWYMYWGSFPGNPIRVREFDPHTMNFTPETDAVEVIHPTESSPLVEATVVVPRYGSDKDIAGYDRFVSGPGTYGLDQYNVWWSFARTPTQPAPLYPHPVLTGNEHVMNTGHPDMFFDDAGDLWAVYLGYDRHELESDPDYEEAVALYGTEHDVEQKFVQMQMRYPRRLYMDRVNFDERGVPYIGPDGSPSVTPQKGPALRPF